MEYLILAILPLAIGIIIGTQLSLIWQLVIFIVGIFYLNSSHVKAMEIGALFPIAMFIWCCIGMVVGDISYIIQTGEWATWNIPNPFVVSK